MNSMQESVRLFHQVCHHPVNDKPISIESVLGDTFNLGKGGVLSGAQLMMSRVSYLQEELAELSSAISSHDMVETADALADILVFLLGLSSILGIDLEKVFRVVMDSNFSKFKTCPDCHGLIDHKNPCAKCQGTGMVAEYHSNGKVKKPTGWNPPDVRASLIAQGADL